MTLHISTLQEPDIDPITVLDVRRSGLSVAEAVEILQRDPRLGGLALPPSAEVAPLEALATSGHAPRVRALLWEGALDASIAAQFPSLEVLHAETFAGDDLLFFEQSPVFLKVLRAFRRSVIGADGFALLATAPAFAALHVLQLIDPSPTDNGVNSYFRSQRPQHLRHLVLANRTALGWVRGLYDSGIYALATAPFVNLTQLDLENHPLGTHLYSLFRNPHLSRLRHLHLAGTRVDSHLSNFSYGLKDDIQLERLDLHHVFATPYGVECVARGCADTLEQLRLYAIGDEGAAALAKGDFLRLERLSLDCCELTSVRALTAAGWMQCVCSLDLSWNWLDDEALAPLVELSGLRSLNLAGNPASFAAVLQLVEQMPGLERIEMGQIDDRQRAVLASVKPGLLLA